MYWLRLICIPVVRIKPTVFFSRLGRLPHSCSCSSFSSGQVLSEPKQTSLESESKMDPARVTRAFEADERAVSLMAGSPGAETLKDCKHILLEATRSMLDNDEGDLTGTFTYGPDNGDKEFRQQLSAFLSEQYGGNPVRSSDVMVTAGATQGLHMVSTFLLHSPATPVFMEDPTYFAAYNMLKKDLHLPIVPVPQDKEGMDTEALERLLRAHCPKPFEERKRPFWAMIYTVPIYNNPTGICISPGRCRRLVELARKYDVLILTEDVYNLIHFGESSHPPPRLLTFDNPSDPDYKGHVLSNGSFSKILAPSLRLGWIEGPERILTLLHGSYFTWSGGSPNHFASRLAATALKLDLQSQHLTHVRQVYKKRRDALCKALRENLPHGATFIEPQGGFFVWVEFPQGTDTFEMVKWIYEKHHVFFMPGICGSIEGKHKHCARISLSSLSEDALVKAAVTVCRAAKEFLAQ